MGKKPVKADEETVVLLRAHVEALEEHQDLIRKAIRVLLEEQHGMLRQFSSLSKITQQAVERARNGKSRKDECVYTLEYINELCRPYIGRIAKVRELKAKFRARRKHHADRLHD